MIDTHHANLLCGRPSEAEAFARSHLERLGVRTIGNPDFLVFKSETFGIDEAREIKRLSARKPLSDFKIFLLVPEKITLEAQSALLKVFEDPTPSTYFFLVAKERGSIIPTLLSRMNAINVPKEEAHLKENEDFLALPLKKRLAFASSFAEGDGDLPEFLDELMLGLGESGERDSLRKVYALRHLVEDKNIGARLVLEHLGLVL